MKVSIVTICYNNEKDIRETIESVLSQTYNDIEYIIKDGGSKDGTLSVVEEYKDKITKVISAPDKGLYDAINTGIQAATGDVVGLIHAGDCLHDERVIEDIAQFFKENDVDVMYGHSRIVDSNGNAKRLNISPRFRKCLVKWGWMASHQSIYAKRDVFEKYGFYTQNVGGSGDYEWFVNVFYKHADDLKIKLNDRYVVRFSLGGQSTVNISSRVQKKNRGIIKQCWVNNGLKPPFALPYRKFYWTIRQFVMARIKE